jgi:hypothetical protein
MTTQTKPEYHPIIQGQPDPFEEFKELDEISGLMRDFNLNRPGNKCEHLFVIAIRHIDERIDQLIDRAIVDTLD